jgi:hypothetical protein
MKPSEAEKYLPFVKALAEGRTVEWRDLSLSPEWRLLDPCGTSDWFTHEDAGKEFRLAEECA